MLRYPWKSVDWANTSFLLGTVCITLTAVPYYIYTHGLSGFQTALFLFFFCSTGLSITLGYHRLFSHLTFKASWPVRLFTLLFGAAAFENSALIWSADHRRHHKHVDHDEDPYDISKGFFHAHIGWILFRLAPQTSWDLVRDLKQDRLVMFQHQHYKKLAVLVGFVAPTLLGWVWGGAMGALGSFLIAGVARVVFVHHMTFFINSLCHTLGRQPYSARCTARDSGIMAWFTFGEGYHNFHHEFQHDYRNGVKPWQFDPTKWAIWLLYKLGLVSNLRRVPEEKIWQAEVSEQKRHLKAKLSELPAAADLIYPKLEAAYQRLTEALTHWEQMRTDYSHAAQMNIQASRDRLLELRGQVAEATENFRTALREWNQVRSLALAHLN